MCDFAQGNQPLGTPSRKNPAHESRNTPRGPRKATLWGERSVWQADCKLAHPRPGLGEGPWVHRALLDHGPQRQSEASAPNQMPLPLGSPMGTA